MTVGQLSELSKELLGSLLLLLTHADLEMLLFSFLIGLVIMARYSIRQISVHVRVLWQDGHYREILVATWAKGPKALYIRDCHTDSF